MSDFNYEITTETKYTFDGAVLYSETAQDGEPTPETPVAVETVGALDDGKIYLHAGSDLAFAIDMQDNELVKLPNGTQDELSIDKYGNVVLTKRTGKYQVTGDETFGSRQYGSFWRIVLSTAIASNPSVAVSTSTGWSNYAPFVGSASAQELHIYTTGNAVAYFNDTETAQEAFDSFIGAIVYYQLETEQTVHLGQIDLTGLHDIETQLEITFDASMESQSNYSYTSKLVYTIENGYEDSNAPEYAYPPNHMGQEWETFDANDWNESEMLDYTGQMESHAVYTVELCELMQSGAFDWSRAELNWSEAAYDQEQYERFCSYFEQRFMFREIGMLPPLQWFTALKRMLVYELMPKYKPLYAQVESGINPLGENEYYKERHVSSAYPETLLSGNSDYISSGEDREWERVKINNAAEDLESYRNGFRSVDAALGDELEVLFISMYTSFANVL